MDAEKKKQLVALVEFLKHELEAIDPKASFFFGYAKTPSMYKSEKTGAINIETERMYILGGPEYSSNILALQQTFCELGGALSTLKMFETRSERETFTSREPIDDGQTDLRHRSDQDREERADPAGSAGEAKVAESSAQDGSGGLDRDSEGAPDSGAGSGPGHPEA